MEKVLSDEFTRLLMIIGLGVISLTALMAKIISRIKGSFKPYKKTTIWYLVLAILLFALAAATVHTSIFRTPITIFIFYQLVYLLFGIAHYYLMHHYLEWTGEEKSFWPELLFTIIVGMFGSMSFMIVYHLLSDMGFEKMMATSICFFVLPFLFSHTFRKAISIPPKIVSQWLYPLHEEIEEPEESKMKNLLVISFEFQKQASDGHHTNFRAKAPTDMEFGQLFYYFINDYNERHPNSKIQFTDTDGEPHGWIFHKKSSWYSIVTRYIEADKTIFMNKIKENDVIICSRCTSTKTRSHAA